MASLFKVKQPKLAAPKVTSMPDPEDPRARADLRRRLGRRSASGREGTIFTRGNTAYTNTSLGGLQ